MELHHQPDKQKHHFFSIERMKRPDHRAGLQEFPPEFSEDYLLTPFRGLRQLPPQNCQTARLKIG